VTLVVLLDAAGAPARSLPPVRVAGGRRVEGPRIDLELQPGERPLVVASTLDALSHDLGRTIVSELRIEGSDAPRTEALEGSRLVQALPLPPSSRLLEPGPGGDFVSVDAERRAQLLGALRLRRVLETEPCPAADRLELHVPRDRNLFSPFGPRAFDSPVTGLHAPAPGVLVVLGRTLAMVARAREVPEREEPPPSPPRDWLLEPDFGGRVELSRLLPVGPGRYFVAGARDERGRAWALALEPGGLRVVGSSSVSRAALADAARFGDRLAVIDERGALFTAPAPLGPWTRVRPPEGASVENTALAGTPDGRLAVGVDERVEILGDGRRAVFTLERGRPPPVSVDALAWSGERVFAGDAEGELFVVTASAARRAGFRLPPRMRACGSEAQPLDAVFVRDEIRSLVTARGHLFAVFDMCSAVVSFRLEDGCSAVVLPSSETRPRPRGPRNERLFVSENRLFLGVDDGLLFETDLAPYVR
jgi:hypothetical protein